MYLPACAMSSWRCSELDYYNTVFCLFFFLLLVQLMVEATTSVLAGWLAGWRICLLPSLLSAHCNRSQKLCTRTSNAKVLSAHWFFFSSLQKFCVFVRALVYCSSYVSMLNIDNLSSRCAAGYCWCACMCVCLVPFYPPCVCLNSTTKFIALGLSTIVSSVAHIIFFSFRFLHHFLTASNESMKTWNEKRK